jgi:monooxygenase
MATDHVDVLIVGAGLSGIGAAAHLSLELPDHTYAILEARAAIGGTWDLFKYPGIRSDSDMNTLGYRFRPWPEDRVLADGPSIKAYVEGVADRFDVRSRIRFGHKALSYSWDSETALWTVDFVADGQEGSITASFLWNCSGYYSYDDPHRPEFPGEDDFKGQIIHPQFWPDDLDYAGKKVVVIGSGATAITLGPSMADDAEHVTMLQRTPTYILSIPGNDPVSPALKKVLPKDIAAGLNRWRNVLLQAGLYQTSQRAPEVVKRAIKLAQRRQLPDGYDVDTHFNPPYNPWDQRLCVVPDGDLFKAIRHGKATIQTGHVDTFLPNGIRLHDGTEIEADIIVTATGLTLLAFGGIDIIVDGEKVRPGDRVAYKGLMLDGVPNFAYVIGYTNASWTLKADLVSEYVIRVLKQMRKNNARTVVPQLPHDVEPKPLMDMESGYMQRGADAMPKQGNKGAWKVPQNYLRDIVVLRHAPLKDDSLTFSA